MYTTIYTLDFCEWIKVSLKRVCSKNSNIFLKKMDRESKKRKAYEILKRNGTLDRIKAQLQLAVFESMGMDNDSTASKSRPNQKEIGTIQRKFEKRF